MVSSIGKNVVKEELSYNGSNLVRPDKMEDVEPLVIPLLHNTLETLLHMYV